MRAFELSLIVVTLLIVVMLVTGHKTTEYFKIAPVVALLLAGLHFWLEGYRLQMVPAYMATVVVLIACVVPDSLRIGKLTGSGLAVCLASAATLAFIMPVFSFPVPTGRFPIGSETRHLIDATRSETQGVGNGEPREVMVQIWYPAEGIGERQHYRTSTPCNPKNMHLRRVQLNSMTGVPIASTQSRYPVLIFSPAWTGNCNQYTFLAEELASHGYLVVGIDHPYGSASTVFPDGRIVSTSLQEWLDYSSDESLQKSLLVAQQQLRIRAADVRFVLDELGKLDCNDSNQLFTGRVDLTRVGTFGHSFGGAVAAEVCVIDSRFLAGVDFDGLLFGTARTSGITKPFLFASDDTPIPTSADLASATGARHRYLAHLDDDVRSIRRSLADQGGYWLTIRGASHANFSDGPLYTPIRSITNGGSIEVRRAMTIICEYTRSFFDKHVNGRDDGLLNGADPRFQDVHFETWPCNASFDHSKNKE